MNSPTLITQNEVNKIAKFILPIFQEVIGKYDFCKYPLADYQHFKLSFSSLSNQNEDIKNALIWKWGHWGKKNFPQHHKDLIVEVQKLWPHFIVSDSTNTSEQTFCWWQEKLVKRTRYITVAFITHLIHHDEPIPIIDQHNFRAMNNLVRSLRPSFTAKIKPSNWQDILNLKLFISLLSNSIPYCKNEEIDRFLMMYGRNCVAR